MNCLSILLFTNYQSQFFKNIELLTIIKDSVLKLNYIYQTIFLTVIIFLLSVYFGAVSFNSSNISLIIHLRIPRIIIAFLIGGMLGLSGALFQLVLKNPLADGFTTGVASSSALGAVIAISLGFPVSLTPILSFLFGFLGLYIVYKIATNSSGLNSVTLILAGIVINIISSSIISFLKFYFDESVGSIVFWLMGGFYQFDYTKIIILFVFLAISFIFFFKNGIKLNVLAFDEISASNMGINFKFYKNITFMAAALLTALAVSFSGIIAFVGLIVPHIVRALIGSNMKKVVLYSTIFGANLTVLSDTLSRSIIPSGAELPVGIVTSILGGFFFIYMLLKRRDKIWNG